MRRLFLLTVLCIELAASRSGAVSAQQVPEGYTPLPSHGFAAKKPVMAGACDSCPWGALADIVKAASKDTQWDIQICYTCSTANSIRLPANHKLPPLRSAAQAQSPLPPYAEVDFGASSPGNLHDGYFGLGTFKDDGPYKSLRLIAMIEQPSYVVVAVKRDGGIRDLADIKNRKMPVKIYSNGAEGDTILSYYGLTKEAVQSWGGLIGPAGGGAAGGGGNAPALKVQDYDVYIHSNAIMANNVESNLMYQVTQLADVTFLQLPDDLVARMAVWPMQRVNLPHNYFRGVDKKIATVGRNGQVVFCRDDAPESFSYDVAKALDQHKDLLKWAVLPFSYNSATVASVKDVPLAPGAARYYKEAGYIK